MAPTPHRPQPPRAAAPPHRPSSPARGFILGLGAALLAAVAFLFVLDQRQQASGNVAPPPPPGVRMAPDFAVWDLEGNVVRLSDLRGRPVVLNFWATWCPPCRAEIPVLIDLQSRYAAQGLRIVGVAMDDAGASVVVPFVKENAINYTVALPNREIVDSYGGIENLPTTFYIGRDGRILQTVTGLISPRGIEEHVREAIATPEQSASPAG